MNIAFDLLNKLFNTQEKEEENNDCENVETTLVFCKDTKQDECYAKYFSALRGI